MSDRPPALSAGCGTCPPAAKAARLDPQPRLCATFKPKQHILRYRDLMLGAEESAGKARPFVLIGAGFSKAISSTMPVMSELAPQVLHNLQLSNEVLDHFEGDLEQWLSFLSGDQPWLSDAENLSNRALFVRASEAVRDVIELAESMATAEPYPPWLMRLVISWCATEATVVTFNYDLLVARMVTELRLVRFWPDLYRTPLADRAASMGVGKMFTPTAPPGNVLGLIKLHGSTNWGFSGLNSAPGEVPCLMSSGITWSGDNDVTNEPRFRALFDDLQPMIVPPTGTKAAYYSSTSLRAQWRRAAEDLRNASSVTVIGNSFPPTDLATRALFASNIACKDVIVVDRQEVAAGTVKKLLDERTNVRSFHGNSALSDYVESECGDLYRWGSDHQSGGWYEINGRYSNVSAEYESQDGQNVTDPNGAAGAKVQESLGSLNLNLGHPFEIYDGLAHWYGERIAYQLPLAPGAIRESGIT